MAIIVIGISGFIVSKKLLTPTKVHYHAGFVVFQNDKKLDFTDFKYMRVKPCLEDKNVKETREDIQAEKAHLHDNVGDVVHVEEGGAIWTDLFTNIAYNLDYSKVKAYENGKEINNFGSRKILPYESVVILIGENSSNHLKDAVSKKYIEEKATKSVDCGD